MEIAILDGKRAYNEKELKKVVIRLLELRPIPSFVMTCYNKTAIEAMKEVKKEHPELVYFVFNWHKDFDREISKHYIRMGNCDKYPDRVWVHLFNKHFLESSDLLISQGEERITVFRHPSEKKDIPILTDP